MTRVRRLVSTILLSAAAMLPAGLIGCANVGPTVLGEGPAATAQPLRPAHFIEPDPRAVTLGRLLFYDKLLSGNRNIACADCHNHDLASGDGVSLGLGEGARGLGAKRRNVGGAAVEQRVPRNAPALFNLGFRRLVTLFHDGRVAVDATQPSGFDTPFEEETPQGLDNVVAAQALAPLVSRVEMAGASEENEVGRAATVGRLTEGWDLLLARLRQTPGYPPLFAAAYPDAQRPEDIRITHVANAIAAFTADEWRADQTPFDRALRGDGPPLPAAAQRGQELFFGRAGCAECHSGPLLTDQSFHAIAMPQIGPGKTNMLGDPSDVGRYLETHEPRDAYRFRTPALRNVTQTAPYGHDGAYARLEDVVRHHLNPPAALDAYDPSQAVLASNVALSQKDFQAMADPVERAAIRAANELPPTELTDSEVADLLAFLGALTDPASLRGKQGKPDSVPSGLPVD